MFDGFSETEPRIKDNVLHAHVSQTLDLFGEIIENFLQEMVVLRIGLHGLRSAFHVHDDVGYSQSGNGCEHVFVHVARRDVVDHGHTVFFHAHLRHIGTEGVNRYDGFWEMFPYDSQPRAQAVHFFSGIDVLGIRSRRVSAYVNDGGSFVYYLMQARGDILLCFGTATGIERVGSYVQYSHDLWLGEVHQPPIGIDK